MLSMTKLRKHSKKVYWFLLVAFISSIVFMGLMGSGSSMVSSLFGDSNPKENNAGQIGEDAITDINYNFLVSNQLTNIRLQNGTITAQDSVNIYQGIWDVLVKQELEKRKAEELGLITPDTEILKELRNRPPQIFQNIFISANMFTDENGSFVLKDYQNAIDSESIPSEFEVHFNQWGPIVDKYRLRPQILENIYRRISTVSDEEIKFEYMKKNTNCNIDYMFIKIADISDDLIEVSDEEIKNEYNKTKDDKYKVPDRRTINYISIRITNSQNTELLDSLNEEAYSFIDEADLTSFNIAAENANYKINNLDIHEGFDNNSGFPFLMGTSRAAVRFIFDNKMGAISEPVKMNSEIIVFQIDSEKVEGYKPLNEIKESIKKTLLKNKKSKYASEILGKLDWADINSDNANVTILNSQEGIVSGRFEEIGTSSELAGTLLGLNPGQISSVVTTYNTACKVKMNSKDLFNQEKYSEAYPILKNQLTLSKNSSNYQVWLKSTIDNSDIKDYRSKKY